MSLAKAIEHGKEHRREYRKSKAFDVSCRVHGGGHKYPCYWCEKDRLYKNRFKDKVAKKEVEEAKSFFTNDHQNRE